MLNETKTLAAIEALRAAAQALWVLEDYSDFHAEIMDMVDATKSMLYNLEKLAKDVGFQPEGYHPEV